MDANKLLGKKLTRHFSMIQAIYIMGYCSIYSYAAVFLLARGFTNSQVGLTLTLSSVMGLLVQPIVASFADKTKKFSLRSIVAVMLLGMIFFALLLFIIPRPVLGVGILYMILLTFFATQVPLVTTMSMDHINNGVPINFSLARGIGSFAYAILSIGLGYLVDDFGAGVIMLVNIALGLLGMALVLSFQKAKRSGDDGVEDEVKPTGLLEFAKNNKRFMLVVASISILFFSHVTISTFMIQIIETVGGSSADMGMANSVAAIVELPAMALFPLLYKKIHNAGLLMKVSGVAFLIKTVVTLVAPSVFWVDAAMSLQFFAYAMFIPASVFYVNEVISGADQNKGQALMGMVMGISGLLGNILGGLMLDSRGGVPFMLTVGLGVSLAGFVMLILVDRRKKTVGNQEKPSLAKTAE
ncbi:MAG: MFS transporter [Anaerolineaceae bacterium]